MRRTVSRRQAHSTEGPRSLCTCGHTGDGPGGQHDDRLSYGHGPCLIKGCDCEQFTWAEWLPTPETIAEMRGVKP